jgi:hypothetical protein
MSTETRKIGFYVARFKKDDDIVSPSPFIHNFFQKFSDMETGESKVLDLPNSKFYFLDTVTKKDDTYLGVFKSAKYNHKPPLIDKVTVEERDNPKSLTEGESEKTHFALKYDSSGNELIIVLESRKSGVSVRNIMYYITTIAKVLTLDIPGITETGTIPVDNFLDAFSTMKRVRLAEAHYTKSSVGTQFSEFANLDENVKDDIVLTTRADYRQNIKNAMNTLVDNFMGQESQIKKIRLYGTDEENNPIMLDSSMTEKREYVSAILNDNTKVVDSSSFLEQLYDKIDEM